MSSYPIPRSNYNHLANYKKSYLIERIRILEDNWQGALDFNEVQADYINFLYDRASDEVKKEFLMYSGNNHLEKDNIPVKNNKKQIIHLRDVKPGQEFYFASDASRDTCVSYGRLPNGCFSVVNMCESPDSNHGEFPGDSEVCLVKDNR